MTIKAVRESAAIYHAITIVGQTRSERAKTVREKIMAERRLARECSRLLQSAIGRGVEARVVFYPRTAKDIGDESK